MTGRITPPTVIVFGPSFSELDGLRQIAEFVKGRPAVSAVLVVEELFTQLLQQAIRSGVADVITVPEDASQLLEAINRLPPTP